MKERVAELQYENFVLQQIHERHVLATCLLNLRAGERNRSYSFDDQLLADSSPMYDKWLENDDDAPKRVRSSSFADFDPKGDFGKELNLKLSLMLDDAEIQMERSVNEAQMTPTDSPDEIRNRIRRERNRVHARRARLRKKFILQKAQQVLLRLRQENEHLHSKLTALAVETGIASSDYDRMISKLPCTQ